jgi:hypothetical protein
MMKLVEEQQVVPILVGDRCIGHAYNRGPAGWSAHDVNDIDLGLGRDFAHAVSKILAATSS